MLLTVGQAAFFDALGKADNATQNPNHFFLLVHCLPSQLANTRVVQTGAVDAPARRPGGLR